MRLWEYIRENMMKNPSQKVCENEAEMSYEELIIFAESFAKKLRGEKCCAVICKSEMAQAMGILCCFAAGVTAIPISYRYGENHCAKILDIITPTCALTDSGGYLDVMYMSDCKYREPDKNPALIMFTSGTTGKPKGVMLSDENIISNAEDITKYFAVDKSDTILISRPLYHCAVLTGEFIVSLIKGVKIRFCSESFNAAAILRLISDYSVTVFGSTPTLMRILARFSKRYKMQSLKKIVISGECMRTASANEIKDAFKDCDIYHVYGLTEAGPRVCFLPPRMFDIAPDSVGIPLSSVSVKIIREDGETANEYENGILYVKGKNIMLGYYNDQEMTGRVLKNGWLCTGDIAYKDEYGLIRIVGRNDDMIIRAGMNIYPQEIEEILKSDVRTKEVMVCGDASRETETKIAMKISGNFKDENEVREMCVRLLAPYQIPDIIEIVAEIPKNGSGKIIRGKAHVGI